MLHSSACDYDKNARHCSKVIIIITRLTITNLEERDSDYPSFTDEKIDTVEVK